MKKRAVWTLAVCAGVFVLAGCGGENQKTYERAKESLEGGVYESALQDYQALISAEYKLAESWRGAGIAQLHMGDLEGAVASFSSAYQAEDGSNSLRQDALSYRAAAELKAGKLDDAMADCQTLAEDYAMTEDTYYLTGCVALAMDSYDEAASNFQKTYGEDATYETAVRIYEAYLDRDMEADGTRYLEAALKTAPRTAEDYCERGRVYYYMQDYDSAKKELTEAANQESTEADLLLGMVYLAQNDPANARSMYQEYLNAEDSSKSKGYNGLALCDMAEGDWDAALADIASGLNAEDSDGTQDLLYNEMVVYERKLDFATALDKAQKYVEQYPDDTDAVKELAFLKSRVNGGTAAENTAAENAASDGTAEGTDAGGSGGETSADGSVSGE